MIAGNKQRSGDQIILACKAVGCPWDPYPPTIQRPDRFGHWFWFKQIRCLNCGSLKIEKYPVGDVYFENRIGKPKYDRPPGWYELKLYWSAARVELARRGYATVDTTTAPEEDDNKHDNNVIAFQQTGVI